MKRFWTVEKAQDAIRAAFFSRSIFSAEGPESVWLRFKEIRQAIGQDQGEIGDRTLSRALGSLVKVGRLRRRREGKASLYSLVLKRPELASALAKAEAGAVEFAGGLGGWGDSTEGWAIFGVSEIVPRRYRQGLRKECLRHQSALRDFLSDIWEEASGALVGPSKKRLEPKIWRKATDALHKLLKMQLEGIEGLAYSARVWKLVETAAPGTLAAYQKALAPSGVSEIPLGEGLALVASKIGGRPVDDIRPEVERELAKLHARGQRLASAINPLWEVLTPKERERAGRRLQAASTMAANLTSVVHG